MRSSTVILCSAFISSAFLGLGGCGSDPPPPESFYLVPADQGTEPVEQSQRDDAFLQPSDAGVAQDQDSSVHESVVTPGYPGAPYGQSVGTIVQNFTFAGLRNPKATAFKAEAGNLTTIELSDFYNPPKDLARPCGADNAADPSKPRVLVVTASALWCSACKEEAKVSMQNYRSWNQDGVQLVEFLTTVFEDANSNPATLKDLEVWTKKYALEYPSVLDPALKLGVFFDKSAAPFNMIVNLCDMSIVYASTGALDTSRNNKTLRVLTGT